MVKKRLCRFDSKVAGYCAKMESQLGQRGTDMNLKKYFIEFSGLFFRKLVFEKYFWLVTVQTNYSIQRFSVII